MHVRDINGRILKGCSVSCRIVFTGYENADWFIPTPALKSEDVDLKLSPDQIRETLNYFSKFNFLIDVCKLSGRS